MEIKVIFVALLDFYWVVPVLSCMHLKTVFHVHGIYPKTGKVTHLSACLWLKFTVLLLQTIRSVSAYDEKGGKWAIREQQWTGKKFKETFNWGFWDLRFWIYVESTLENPSCGKICSYTWFLFLLRFCAGMKKTETNEQISFWCQSSITETCRGSEKAETGSLVRWFRLFQYSA